MRDNIIRFLRAVAERIQHLLPVRHRLARLLDRLRIIDVPVVCFHTFVGFLTQQPRQRFWGNDSIIEAPDRTNKSPSA